VDLYTMLRQIGDRVLAIFGVTSGYIGLYDSGTNLIEFPYFLENGVPSPTPPVPLGQGLSSLIVQTRRPLLINQNTAQKMQELGAMVLGDPALSYLGVPIVVGDDVTGILNVQSTTQEGLFNEDDVRLLSIIGASVGVAIENARLFQQTQTALAETEALYQASADLNTAQGFTDLLAALRRHTVLGGAQLIELHYFDRPWTARQLPEETELIARWTVGEAGEPVAMRQLLPAWMSQHLRADLPLIVEDIVGDQRLDDNARAAYLIRYGAQSAIFLPLVVGGDWLGYLSAFYATIIGFPEAEARRLAGLSRQAAVQVENFRNTALIERRAQQLVTASEVSRAAISLTNTEELITQAVELIRERFGLYYVALFLTDGDRRWAVLVYATGEAGRQLLERGHRLEIGGNSMVGWATAHRRARVAQDVGDEKVRFANPFLPDTRSELALPLVVGDQVLGALSVQSIQRKAFGDAEVTSLQTMADQIAIAIRNAQALGDLRLAVQALDYERFLLQTLLDNVPDKIYFKDQHGRFIRVSQAVARQFGLRPEQVSGKSDFDFFSEEHARQAYQDEQDLMRSGQPLLGKLERETWPDGPDSWVLTSKLILRNPEGQPVGTFGISRDVTELKTAQEEAQRRVRQLLAAAEVSRAVTSLLDERELIRRAVELIYERFNLYYVALFLLEEDGRWAVLQHAAGGAANAGDLLLKLGHRLEAGGQSMIGWTVANRRARISADVAEETVRFANPLTPETRSEMALPLLAGETMLGALSVQSSERHAFSEADVAILQTMADQITSALQNARLFRRVERQEFNASALAHSAQAIAAHLEEAEVWETLADELLATFRADGVVVYRWEPETATFTPRVVRVGPAVVDPPTWPAAGIPVAATERPDLREALEQPGGRTRALGREDQGQLRESMTAALLYQETVDSVVEVVHTGPASGLTADDTSLLQAAVTTAASALQIARLYALQRETAERLLEVDRLKTQFLANMSHELRTPLNSIIGFSRVILKGIDGPINDLQRQDLGSIYNSGQHLLGLINDILDLSRIEAGKMELSFEPVHLPEIFEGVLATTRGLIKDKPIEIVRDYPLDLPAVRGDSTRLRQVLLNLLSNAAKFTDRGRITLAAGATVDETGRPAVEIRVADTGQGIPPADMSKLFERFSQVDGSPTRKVGGTGLGLNISRHLVELHGGRIWAESTGVAGQGATFVLVLPLEASAAPEPAADQPLVLVIHEDPALLGLYRRYLEAYGYAVAGTPLGGEAVSAAADHQPVAIVMDTVTPDAAAWQVLTELRQHPATAAAPVIMCALVDERERALAGGAADYLVKPILESDLARALDRLVKMNGAWTPG
jgi:PAS domain S-box-containing protein